MWYEEDKFDRDSFDNEFEENRKLYAKNPEEAHQRQIRTVEKLDKHTGKKSYYDGESGVWYLSDGRQSDESSNGVIGNSAYDGTYDYKKSANYKIYMDKKKNFSNSAFEYDYTKDPLYKSMENSAKKIGSDIMTDTTAKAAALTGGMAGSYAVAAGADSYNNYMEGLNDIALELENRAYQKFLDEQNKKLRELSYIEKEMDREKSDWTYNNAVIEDKEKRAKENENKYKTAMYKIQNEDISAMTNADWEAIYNSGGWYDKTAGLIYDKDGNAFIPHKSDTDYRLVLMKFQDTGWHSLSDKEKKIAMENGWYDINTGYLYDSAGNAYASKSEIR